MNDYSYDLIETAVETASPAELTLMLYDGAIRFANNAIIELEQAHFDEASEDISKVSNIIQEFQTTLNRDYEISEPMYDLYQYMFRRLCQATVDDSASLAIVTEVRDLLRDFRTTWRKAMDIALV